MPRYQICPTCSPNAPLATFRQTFFEDCVTPCNRCNHCGHMKPIARRVSARAKRVAASFDRLDAQVAA